jgi:predicted RNA-binding Zn-ribbon protein involved in translation (DUF1610 family)
MRLCGAGYLHAGISVHSDSNLSGIAVSALGGFLTLVGLATSPVLLLLLGISLVTHSPEIKPSDPVSASVAVAKPDSQSIASPESQVDMPCPVGGAATVLRGMASRSLNGKFVLKTDKPFCLTLNPPVAPRQRAVLSSVEIDGQPPPLDVLIELTGKLYASPLAQDGAETPVLEVTSGRRVRTE